MPPNPDAFSRPEKASATVEKVEIPSMRVRLVLRAASRSASLEFSSVWIMRSRFATRENTSSPSLAGPVSQGSTPLGRYRRPLSTPTSRSTAAESLSRWSLAAGSPNTMPRASAIPLVRSSNFLARYTGDSLGTAPSSDHARQLDNCQPPGLALVGARSHLGQLCFELPFELSKECHRRNTNSCCRDIKSLEPQSCPKNIRIPTRHSKGNEGPELLFRLRWIFPDRPDTVLSNSNKPREQILRSPVFKGALSSFGAGFLNER